MSQTFTNDAAPAYVLRRIINFLNEAKTFQDIMEGIRDDPSVTTGDDPDYKDYAIGETVARRILEHRQSLPRRRFSAITELNGIQGLGPDKFRDMIYSLGKPAAEAFQESMYDGVISKNNFDLEFFVRDFENESEFQEIQNCRSKFIELVGEMVEEVVTQKHNRKAGIAAGRYVKQCWLERADHKHSGSHYFAYWFYRFDADNWFSFDQVRLEAEKYIYYYSPSPPGHDITLHFFKGFENAGLLADAITPDDLPVMINEAEKRVTMWVGSLRD